jgi:acyl-CoA synthetase (NDP forming)
MERIVADRRDEITHRKSERIGRMTAGGVPLDEVFSPRGVAVVGASGAEKLSFAEIVVHSLKEAAFPAIYPVNPKYAEVLGLRCYPDLVSIPGVVDHVVVNIPAESALELLDQCAAKGVRSVHFFTAGFGESGFAERAELEAEMLKKARAGGFRIIGPNCVGLFVPGSRLTNMLGAPLEPGPIGFISQSGGHASNIPVDGGPRGLRFSKIVSYGNALDVDESELLEYLCRDRETEIIAAYLEGVRDGRRFLKALREAAARKPVVVYKGGKTEAGKRATFGHTASMTSSVAVFEGLCRQTHAIQVDDLDGLIDVLVALRFVRPLPRGRGVAVAGAGGGPSVLASDEVEKAGLELPQLSSEVQAELRRDLPLAGSIFSNPVDTPNLATPNAVSSAIRVLSEAPEIDMIIYHLGFHPISQWGFGRFSSPAFLEPVIESFSAATEATDKPVLLALRPPRQLKGMEDFAAAEAAFVKAGLPVFHSLRDGARAMARAVAWSQASTRQ